MTTGIFRGEHFELSWGEETTYGDDIGTAALVNPFGVFERGQLADPEIEFTPFYGGGGEQARRFFRAYQGRWSLEANIADVLLLDGKNLVFPFGNVVTTGSYTHTISESTLLRSFTMHASQWRQGDAADTPRLMRRYLGGKVGRATLTAEEGERLRMSYDSILFNDFIHNVNGTTPKYSATVSRPTLVYPSLQPFFFSGGELAITGAVMAATTYARIRSFRLDINNNCEAKYYVAGHNPAIPTPYEVLEGRREYGLSVVVDPDDWDLYAEILEAGKNASAVPIGVKVVMTFSRTASTDDIVIYMPSATPAITAQGGFIRRGKLDIDAGSPATPQELDILVRRVDIVVHDADAWSEFAA